MGKNSELTSLFYSCIGGRSVNCLALAGWVFLRNGICDKFPSFLCANDSLSVALMSALRTLSLNSVFQVSLIKSVILMQISVT